MSSQPTLVQSSPTTRIWLHRLRDELSQLKYSEAKYWAAFKTEPRGGTVARLNPSQQRVRVFLALDPREHSDLKPTPSSSEWAKKFPSVFWIADEHDLTHARELILKSHAVVRSGQKKVASRAEFRALEELLPGIEYVEGCARAVLVNAYERSRQARQACIRHYGKSCVACGFSFEATYGAAVAGYIQVHHIVPISQVRQEYRLNPITDLRPVCPNCHAVIHRREPPFSIEDVRQMVQECLQHPVGKRNGDQ